LQIVGGIQATFEYRIGVVNSLWRKYLHRAAEQAAQQWGAQSLALGETIEQLSISVTSSPEYFKSQANNTTDGFLDALYLDAFQRPVDAGARAAFAQSLTPNQIGLIVFSSNEYHRKLVDQLYRSLLDRPSEESALNLWEGSLRSGMTTDGLVAVLASADEFFNKTAT
jgi:hypothetical protein